MSSRVSIDRSRVFVPIVLAVAVAILTAFVAPSPAQAVVASTSDDFYSYAGSTPLAEVAPGTVLKTRTVPYHISGLLLPLTATQLLYRSTGSLGQPTVNVTSVISSPFSAMTDQAISYQSFYDSLNPLDDPSHRISGERRLAGIVFDAEFLVFTPFLLQGYTIIIPDSEGKTANFAAGPEYGLNTLDSIRAVTGSPATGLSEDAEIGMIGYSGGAIATNWAAALAPSYAPDVNDQIVGAAEGGVLVAPAHNLHYVDGSLVWAGVIPMALIGVARAFDIDMKPYLSDYGLKLYDKLQTASITNVLGQYPGLTWDKLAKPAFESAESIPVFVEAVNKLNLGSVDSPTIPMFIGQGANGLLEGTLGNKPGIGRGDGVMIAGDVRSLARQYCSDGTPIKYTQYDLLSHITSVALWLPAAITWLNQRFAGVPAPQNCASIAPGNSLAPVPTPTSAPGPSSAPQQPDDDTSNAAKRSPLAELVTKILGG